MIAERLGWVIKLKKNCKWEILGSKYFYLLKNVEVLRANLIEIWESNAYKIYFVVGIEYVCGGGFLSSTSLPHVDPSE